MRCLEKTAVEAKKLAHIFNFKAQWKSYCAVQKKNQPLSPNTTNFTDQPLELACGKYECNDQGIYFYDERMGNDICVCTHPIMPTRRLINIDSGEMKTEIAFLRGHRWKTVLFDKQTTCNASKIVALASYGVGVDSENAKALVAYLSYLENRNYDLIPESKSVGHMGWVEDDGFAPYLNAVTFDGHESYRHAYESIHANGDFDTWLTLAREVRKGKSVVARIALVASFASVLVSKANALPFIVHLWGGSGAGKTVGLMLATSVWASPLMGHYMRTFNATAVGNELSAAFCGNLPLCLDELQCIKERKSFDEIIYMLCEGAGKSRGAKGGGLQRTNRWCNCTISTGEMPITSANSGGGAMGRVLEFDCKGEKLFVDPRNAVTILSEHYGHAGRAFIALLRQPSTLTAFDKMQKLFAVQMNQTVLDKHVLSASILLATDSLLSSKIFEDDHYLTLDDIAPYLLSKTDADDNLRAYHFLMDTIASHAQHFKNDPYTDSWGEIGNDGRAYIIKSVFDRLMSEGGYNARAFLSWAKRKGWIRFSGNHATIPKRINRSPLLVRCVAIDMNKDESGHTLIDTC